MSEVNQADICYVILLSPTNQDRRDMEIIRGHVKHLQELDRKGQLVLCGPFSDCPGGMVIVRASSREEAVLLAEKILTCCLAFVAMKCVHGVFHMRETGI